MKRHLLIATAFLRAASAAQASIIFFDDALQNGATLWKEGTSTSTLAPAGEPYAGASPNVKLNMVAWSQAGVRINRTVTAPDTFVQADIYRVGGGDLHLRTGTGWTDIVLNASNSAYWTIDGQPGNYSFASNAWHTLLVDVAGLGISTTVNTVGAKAGGSASVWYMDNVMLVPEPTTFAAIGLGSLALLRRRRQA